VLAEVEAELMVLQLVVAVLVLPLLTLIMELLIQAAGVAVMVRLLLQPALGALGALGL
jgi:hypothetical protein